MNHVYGCESDMLCWMRYQCLVHLTPCGTQEKKDAISDEVPLDAYASDV